MRVNPTLNFLGVFLAPVAHCKNAWSFDMSFSRLAVAALVLTASAFALSACHVAGHLPPGQVKHVLSPPPGHGGTPPGHMKK